MNIFLKKAIGLALAGCLAVGCALPAFAAETGTTALQQEEGTTALQQEEGTTNTGTGDTDGDGTLTAADARELALSAQNGNAAADGDYNMDGSVSLADAKILLRAAAGIAPTASLDVDDPLAGNGLGLYDSVLSANGKSYSAAEYSYYYTSLYMSYAQQSYYYDYYYGEGYGAMLTGFDYQLSPAEQYLSTSDGSQVSYAVYFNELAIATMEQYSYYAAQAKALGLELDEEDQAYIDENMTSILQTADSYGMTLDAFLEEQYGAGINSYIFMNVIYEQLYAQKYQEHMQQEIADSITDEQIDAQYESDPTAYNLATLRAMRFSVTENEDGTSDAEQQQAAAADFMSSVTDEASFIALAAEVDPVNFPESINSLIADIDYDTLAQYVGEDAADWAFSADRKTADMQIFTTGSYIYVLFISEPAAKNEECLPSVRHILVSFDDSEEVTSEEGVTDAYGNRVLSREEAYALCEDYLKEYERGDRTEESFAALAEKYSEDTASLSSGGQGSEGGLYSDIPRGQFVEPFEEWAYDASREVGDTGIIESEHGYHIMYFCGRAEEPDWKATIREELASEQTEEYMESLADKYAGSASYRDEDAEAAYTFALQAVEGYFA